MSKIVKRLTEEDQTIQMLQIRRDMKKIRLKLLYRLLQQLTIRAHKLYLKLARKMFSRQGNLQGSTEELNKKIRVQILII